MTIFGVPIKNSGCIFISGMAIIDMAMWHFGAVAGLLSLGVSLMVLGVLVEMGRRPT